MASCQDPSHIAEMKHDSDRPPSTHAVAVRQVCVYIQNIRTPCRVYIICSHRQRCSSLSHSLCLSVSLSLSLSLCLSFSVHVFQHHILATSFHPELTTDRRFAVGPFKSVVFLCVIVNYYYICLVSCDAFVAYRRWHGLFVELVRQAIESSLRPK